MITSVTKRTGTGRTIQVNNTKDQGSHVLHRPGCCQLQVYQVPVVIIPSPSGRGIIIHNPYGAIVNPTVRMLNTSKKSTVQKILKF